jgi:tyrosine-protein kinase Etk/Wzc
MGSEVRGKHVQERDTQAVFAHSVHFLDLLIILSKRRRFIVLFTLSTAVLTLITVLILPSSYTATTLVLPPVQNSSMGYSVLGQLGGSGTPASAGGLSFGFKNPGDLYVSLFRSRTVEDSLIQRSSLMAKYDVKTTSKARSAFEAHSKVLLGARDGLVTIRVTDRDPKDAAEIANAYVEEFRKLSANLAITEASQRRAFFQQQLREANESLAAAEEAMKHTEQTTGVVQIDNQARSLIESAANLRGQISAKEVQLQGMRSYATDDNPQMMMVEQQLAELKVQLAKLAGTDENAGSEIIVPKGNIPEAGMEYMRKLRDVKYYETISELIAKQFELAKLDEARQGAVIQVVDLAVPPDEPSFPKRAISVAVAILVGFFAAFGWCIFTEGTQRLKSNPDERQRFDTLRATFK